MLNRVPRKLLLVFAGATVIAIASACVSFLRADVGSWLFSCWSCPSWSLFILFPLRIPPPPFIFGDDATIFFFLFPPPPPMLLCLPSPAKSIWKQLLAVKKPSRCRLVANMSILPGVRPPPLFSLAHRYIEYDLNRPFPVRCTRQRHTVGGDTNSLLGITIHAADSSPPSARIDVLLRVRRSASVTFLALVFFLACSIASVAWHLFSSSYRSSLIVFLQKLHVPIHAVSVFLSGQSLQTLLTAQNMSLSTSAGNSL